MTKRTKQIGLIAAGVLVLLYVVNPSWRKKAVYTSDEAEPTDEDDFFLGGGGSGFVPGGIDDTDSLNYDPDSSFTYVKPSFDDTEPIVGASRGGNYTSPYIGSKPPNTSTNNPGGYGGKVWVKR